MNLLKFITCGSVDDGKSTLIGHILYDSKLLYADQEKALLLDSRIGSRGGAIDYSLLLDGLTEEREQGITIDVAYRYFTTERRSFIVADTPGHEEYTRNMAVGASFADLAVILIDASKGVLVQTRRHARIAKLMGIRFFAFAVNKMDLIGYEEKKFQEIVEQIHELEREIGLEHVSVFPVSATEGDNVTHASQRMPWYRGQTLLSYLEEVDVAPPEEADGFYMPVQRVCRPNRTFRGFEGQIEAGDVRIGDEVTTYPSRERAHISQLIVAGRETDSAVRGQPATIVLDREVDTSRGCVLAAGAELQVTDSLEATILWMDDEDMEIGANFYVKLGTRMVPGIVTEILYRVDIVTGEHKAARRLKKNEIARCRLDLTEKIVADCFSSRRTLGELILIDRVTYMTSACGTVERILQTANRFSGGRVTEDMRAALAGQTPVTVEFRIGQNGVTRQLAEEVERKLLVAGRHTYLYEPRDGEAAADVVRHLGAAGILVLLVLREDFRGQLLVPGGSSYISGWEKTLHTADEISEFIEELSRYRGEDEEAISFI